jgi:transcriptional regulator
MEALAGDVFEKLAKAIVAFEMPIDRIEGQFKLGQNRSRDDRVGMLKGLDAEKSPDAEALAAFIRETLSSDGAAKD